MPKVACSKTCPDCHIAYYANSWLL